MDGNQKGFTLIELIVVIVLLGLMFAFTIPRMDGYLFKGDTDTVSKWIILNVAELKNKSVEDQVNYILNADTNENAFFISIEDMDEETLEEAKKNSFKLPDDVNLVDIVYPFELPEEEEITGILFNKKGFSDNAIIHIENDDGKKFSYILQPFLPIVEIKEGFVLFDEN